MDRLPLRGRRKIDQRGRGARREVGRRCALSATGRPRRSARRARGAFAPVALRSGGAARSVATRRALRSNATGAEPKLNARVQAEGHSACVQAHCARYAIQPGFRYDLRPQKYPPVNRGVYPYSALVQLSLDCFHGVKLSLDCFQKFTTGIQALLLALVYRNKPCTELCLVFFHFF